MVTFPVFSGRLGSLGPLLSCFLFQACLASGDSGLTPTGPDEPEGPTTGTLEIEVLAYGTRPDPDGYSLIVTVGGQDLPAMAVEPTGGTFRLPDLPPGTLSVRLLGLAVNCRVEGGSSRQAHVFVGRTAKTELKVRCPAPGQLLVRTTTIGRDGPAGGYTIFIEGLSTTLELGIGLNDELLLSEDALPPSAQWRIRIAGIPDNCAARTTPTPILLTGLRGDATTEILYSILCIQRSTRIAFELDGRIKLFTGSQTIDLAEGSLPSLSPDRQRILFHRYVSDFEADLYVVNVDGTGLRQLTHGGAWNEAGPQAWSPDGSKIVFSRSHFPADDAGEIGDIYVMNADGSQLLRLTHDDDAFDYIPAWSPNGALIAFSRYLTEEDVTHIYRMDATDGSGVAELIHEGYGPAWSPDGSRIAYISGGSAVAVVGSDGSGLALLHLGGGTVARSPSWAPDGSQIAFVSGDFNSERIAFVSFDGAVFGEIVEFFRGVALSWR